jgi:ABC transport system ATP-binding/permease protein
LRCLSSSARSSGYWHPRRAWPARRERTLRPIGIISLAGKPGLEQIAAIAPARCGMAALASTAWLNRLNPPMGARPDSLWKHTSGVWLLDMGLMLVLSAIFLLLSWCQLNRLSPGRRK